MQSDLNVWVHSPAVARLCKYTSSITKTTNALTTETTNNTCMTLHQMSIYNAQSPVVSKIKKNREM